MKIKRALLSMVAVVVVGSTAAGQYRTLDQYTQYPAASAPTQFPRYAPQPFAPPTARTLSSLPAATRSSTPIRDSIRGWNTFPTAVGEGPAIHQHQAPIQVAPSFGGGHEYHAAPVQTQFGGEAHCSTCYTDRRRGGWYGGVSGLAMTRDNANNVWLSYDQADIRERVLNSNDADFDYSGGFGFNIGRYFNCGRNSINASYWGNFSNVPEANAYGADQVTGLDTILHFDSLSYDPGTGAALIGPGPGGGTFHFDAERHRVRREYEVHNIELNLLGHNYSVGCAPGKGCSTSQKQCGGSCRPLSLGWAAGVRFLRFDEGFLYSSDPNDITFTGDPEELHYGIDVQNNLIGFQLGGRADYCLGGRFNMFADTKIGLYGNRISHNSRIYGSNGNAFVSDAASPYFNTDMNIDSNKTDVSMIGELLVGGDWCINRCWTIGAGYRAVGVSGIALATNQIPVDFIATVDSLRQVDSNGNLILHGGFLRLEYSR